MYYDYFGLNQAPFKITPDTNLFYPGGNRGAILEALIYAICSGEGIVKVVGEVGSGKTMLCRMLQKELPDTVEIVYLANPSLSPENILHAIAFELKLPVQSSTSRLIVMNKLQQYLLQKHSINQQVVVFVEEAQSMPIVTLEEIRLLSNLETQQNKLLQIILFGQPELDEMISKSEIRQLKERITYSFLLSPFKINDIREYLNSRLRACGYCSGEIFNQAAVKVIRKYSKGLVRRINILADKSMLAAYASNTAQIKAIHVKQAARDSEFISNWRRSWLPVVSVFSITLLVIFLLWQYRSTRQDFEAIKLGEHIEIDSRANVEQGFDISSTETEVVVKSDEVIEKYDDVVERIVNTNEQDIIIASDESASFYTKKPDVDMPESDPLAQLSERRDLELQLDEVIESYNDVVGQIVNITEQDKVIASDESASSSTIKPGVDLPESDPLPSLSERRD